MKIIPSFRGETLQEYMECGLRLIQLASLAVNIKDIQHGCFIFAVYFQSTKEMGRYNSEANMQEIIKTFEDIFHEPTQLPPAREAGHCIPFKKGSRAINVRRSEKDESETSLRHA